MNSLDRCYGVILIIFDYTHRSGRKQPCDDRDDHQQLGMCKAFPAHFNALSVSFLIVPVVPRRRTAKQVGGDVKEISYRVITALRADGRRVGISCLTTQSSCPPSGLSSSLYLTPKPGKPISCLSHATSPCASIRHLRSHRGWSGYRRLSGLQFAGPHP